MINPWSQWVYHPLHTIPSVIHVTAGYSVFLDTFQSQNPTGTGRLCVEVSVSKRGQGCTEELGSAEQEDDPVSEALTV